MVSVAYRAVSFCAVSLLACFFSSILSAFAWRSLSLHGVALQFLCFILQFRYNAFCRLVGVVCMVCRIGTFGSPSSLSLMAMSSTSRMATHVCADVTPRVKVELDALSSAMNKVIANLPDSEWANVFGTLILGDNLSPIDLLQSLPLLGDQFICVVRLLKLVLHYKLTFCIRFPSSVALFSFAFHGLLAFLLRRVILALVVRVELYLGFQSLALHALAFCLKTVIWCEYQAKTCQVLQQGTWALDTYIKVCTQMSQSLSYSITSVVRRLLPSLIDWSVRSIGNCTWWSWYASLQRRGMVI